MNEELIRQCAREVVPFVDEPGTGEQNYRYAAAVMAIETYHARAVQPLRRENEELRALVKDLNEQARRDGERIGGLEARMAELTEAAEAAHDTLHECTAVLTNNDVRKVAAVMERLRAALAAFGKEEE